MTARLEALAAELKAPLLVTNLVNVFYLCGFESSNAALLVKPKGGATLFTDFRYAESAAEVQGVDLQITKRTMMVDLASRLRGRVQVEADVLPYLEWERLSSGGLKVIPTHGLVDTLRAVKDEEEVAKIRRACRVADRAFEALTAETFVGRTEKEVAWRLRELLHAHGADEQSFDTIVASGPRGAMPHAHPTDNIIETRTLVTVDWGTRVDGYCSDCTRTVSTGDLPGRLREIYDVCLRAQERACAEIRPGMTGVDADALARDPIEAAGYGDAFGHGLGHGVGLMVHEAPRLSTESPDTLAAGHVFSVEPGIYLPDEGGVRIEDLAVLREDGPELLTTFPKRLIDVS